MPHLVIDFSQGLEAGHDMNALCKAVFDALILDPEINPPAPQGACPATAPISTSAQSHRPLPMPRFICSTGATMKPRPG